MASDSNQDNLKRLEEWSHDLACPACLGALRTETSEVVCAACGRAYPVVDGIPVLIAERATKAAQ